MKLRKRFGFVPRRLVRWTAFEIPFGAESTTPLRTGTLAVGGARVAAAGAAGRLLAELEPLERVVHVAAPPDGAVLGVGDRRGPGAGVLVLVLEDVEADPLAFLVPVRDDVRVLALAREALGVLPRDVLVAHDPVRVLSRQ